MFLFVFTELQFHYLWIRYLSDTQKLTTQKQPFSKDKNESVSEAMKKTSLLSERINQGGSNCGSGAISGLWTDFVWPFQEGNYKMTKKIEGHLHYRT